MEKEMQIIGCVVWVERQKLRFEKGDETRCGHPGRLISYASGFLIKNDGTRWGRQARLMS
jgi:hypothetical protein